MTTFAEFMVNLLKKIGIYYVFSILFLATITYVLSFNLIKKFSAGTLDDKKINSISMLLAICVAILASSLYRIADMLSYFLVLFSTMTIVLLFTFAIFIFIMEKKPTISDTGARNIFILILIFVIVFIFVAFYFAFQDILIQFSYGNLDGKTQNALYDIFSYIFRAEILIIPFLFVILGLALMVLGAQQEQKK